MSTDPKSLLAHIVSEFEHLLDPLEVVQDDPQELYVVLANFGWNPNGFIGADLTTIPAIIMSVKRAIADVRTTEAFTHLNSLTKPLLRLRDALSKMDELIKALNSAEGLNAVPATQEALRRDLLEHLLVTYLVRRAPRLYQVLVLLKVIHFEQVHVLSAGSSTSRTILRYPMERPTLKLENFSELLSDPVGHLKKAYLPSGVTNDQAAQVLVGELFGRIESLVFFLGGHAMAGLRGALNSDFDDPTSDILLRSFTVAFPIGPFQAAETGGTITTVPPRFGATFTIIPADAHASSGGKGPGLEVVPFGMASFVRQLEQWTFTVSSSGKLGAFFISPNKFEFADSTASHLKLLIKLTKAQSAAPAFLVGGSTSTRLEIGQLTLSGATSFDLDEQEYGFLIEFGSSAFVVSASEGDAFLQKMLPKDGVRTDFDLALGWSNKKGFHFRGSAGLELTLPVHKSILDVLTVESVYLALQTRDIESGVQDPAIDTVAAATAKIKLGPFKASVERMGLQATFTFPPKGGNLGPVNVELGFKPPDGAGMVLDISAIAGGGYLFHDPKNEEYGGVLQLEIKGGISLKAIGLLTTRLPDGSKGFSLLLIITAEFPPIQLGFGFTLNGVGGLLGANRTLVVEALQAGVRNGSVDQILFPKDPVSNAPQLISDLRTYFPPAEGQFAFGPMAILGWGTPPIILAELGIILQLPEPIRLIILGQIHVLLPQKPPALPPKPTALPIETVVVELHLDVLGVIDFTNRRLSIDATLHDSRIAAFNVHGDMAMRLSWGGEPNFALSVGGLHPQFQPPPDFPTLRRLTLSLGTGKNPRLTLQAYLAVTSNTAQFGALAELYAEKASFNLYGHIGFDVLLVFQPFALTADFSASVALRKGRKVLATVHLTATLTGPTPWHAWGEASISLLFLSVTVQFDATFGERRQLEVTVEDPWPVLKAEIEKVGNWSTTLPPAASRVVSLKAAEGAPTLVDPLGGLTLCEKAVPFERILTKFGQGKLPQPRRFAVLSVSLGDQPLKSEKVQKLLDHFAPGQFEEMTDAQKLSRSSFERMQAGVTIASDAVSFGPTTSTTYGYKTVMIDAPDAPPITLDGTYQLQANHLLAMSRWGASARAPLHTTGLDAYAPPPGQAKLVSLTPETYQILPSSEAEFAPEPGTKGAMHQALAAYLLDHPAERDRFQVVPSYEVGT